MNKPEIRYYVTLEESFGRLDLAIVQNLANVYTRSAGTLDKEFGDVLNILDDSYRDWFIGFIDKPVDYSGQGGSEPTYEETSAVKEKFIRKLIITYDFTKDKYIYLLNLYEEQKGNLMNQLSTTVTVKSNHRVNDTPQNGGLWTDDKHSSSYEEGGSTTTTGVDPKTVMERIAEIQDNYKSVIGKWCKEFEALFIPPQNEIND